MGSRRRQQISEDYIIRSVSLDHQSSGPSPVKPNPVGSAVKQLVIQHMQPDPPSTQILPPPALTQRAGPAGTTALSSACFRTAHVVWISTAGTRRSQLSGAVGSHQQNQLASKPTAADVITAPDPGSVRLQGQTGSRVGPAPGSVRPIIKTGSNPPFPWRLCSFPQGSLELLPDGLAQFIPGPTGHQLVFNPRGWGGCGLKRGRGHD